MMNTLGKVLFPDQAAWQQQKSLKVFLLTLAMGAFTSGLFLGYAFMQIHKH